MNLQNLSARLQNRVRRASAGTCLTLRRKLIGRPFWIDLGPVKLPYHGDGDRQELYYYLDGKEWWEKETKLISPYLKKGDVAVDVGANLGFMSGILSAVVGPSGQVHSFEPSPTIYAKLQEVIKENNLTNVASYNMGCGKEEQSLTLYSPGSSGNATLRPDAGLEKSTKSTQTVRIAPMDDFLGPKLSRLDFIKIDTEGFEDDVLFGASRLIEKYQPVIYVELGSLYPVSSANAVRFLRSHGYTFDREPDIEKSYSGDNFFAIPADRARQFGR